MGLDDGADVGRQLRVLLLAALPAPRGEVLQAAHAVMLLVQSLLDRLASPAEAVLGLAGVAAAQCRGHLGLEQAALVSGEPSGPRPNQGVVLLDGVFHHSGPARGETVTDRPRSAHHSGGQDSSVWGRFPSSGRLVHDAPLPDHVLQQGPPQTLGHTSLDLTLRQEGVQDLAHVLHGGHVEHRDFAGQRVHFQRDDAAAPGVRHVGIAAIRPLVPVPVGRWAVASPDDERFGLGLPGDGVAELAGIEQRPAGPPFDLIPELSPHTTCSSP